MRYMLLIYGDDEMYGPPAGTRIMRPCLRSTSRWAAG